MSNNITIFGVGKLGICFGLNLERKGYSILGVDVTQDYVDSINNKTLVSTEPQVNTLLDKSKNLKVTMDVQEGIEFSDTLFVLVATPSLENGKYDHSQVDRLVDQILERGRQETPKDLVIGCTTMPGYCDELQERVEEYNYRVSYNPEFIAQGTIINDQTNPDMVLIGASHVDSIKKLTTIYKNLTQNDPPIQIMSPLSAELCKISLNCFITTKIAFTNMIGDLADKVGAEPQKILNAIGNDSRVGLRCTRYGFGFGGPCFPRDNRALGIYAKENDCAIDISDATDKCNDSHLQYMLDSFTGDELTLTGVSYKPESTMIEESQQLAYAVGLAKRGVKVTVVDKPEVIDEVKKLYGDLLNYAF